MSKTILVTGAAGFIGSHASQAFLTRGDTSADRNCRVFATNDQMARLLEEVTGRSGWPKPAAPDPSPRLDSTVLVHEALIPHLVAQSDADTR